MSYVVDKAHIDALVTAALAWGLVDRRDVDEYGRDLWTANLSNVRFQQPHDANGERNGPAGFRDEHVELYVFEAATGRPDPDVVAYAVQSLEYNSCDFPGWATSRALLALAELALVAGTRAARHAERFGRVNPHDISGSPLHAWDIADHTIYRRAMELRQKASTR